MLTVGLALTSALLLFGFKLLNSGWLLAGAALAGAIVQAFSNSAAMP